MSQKQKCLSLFQPLIGYIPETSRADLASILSQNHLQKTDFFALLNPKKEAVTPEITDDNFWANQTWENLTDPDQREMYIQKAQADPDIIKNPTGGRLGWEIELRIQGPNYTEDFKQLLDRTLPANWSSKVKAHQDFNGGKDGRTGGS